MTRLLSALALLALTGCTSPIALAQKYPPEPIRWLVLRPPPVPLVTYSCTAPLLSNFGTCEAPRDSAYSAPMTVRWRWTGPAAGEAFVTAFPGDSLRISVPADAESLTVVTERSGRSCGDVRVAVR